MSKQTGLPRADSSNYWGADAWDPDERVYVGASDGQTRHHMAVEQKGKPPVEQKGEPPVEQKGKPPVEQKGEPPAEEKGESPEEPPKEVKQEKPSVAKSASKDFTRRDSTEFWGAEGWDPDERIYVGAADHNTAVHDDRDKASAAPKASAAAPPSTSALASASDCGGGASSPSKAPASGALVRNPSANFWDSMGGADQATMPTMPSGAEFLVPEVTASSPPVASSGGFACSPSARSPASPTTGKSSAVEPLGAQRGDSESYWDQGDWGSPAQKLRRPADNLKVDEETKKGGKFDEPNSAAYWEAEQWDPDERIYVGAEAGAKNHLLAVDPDDGCIAGTGFQLTQVWRGGLVCVDLKLGESVGPPIDLTAAKLEKRPAMKDQYEMLDVSVGSGAFGVVRKAKHINSGTKCVVKAIKKSAAGETYRTNLIENKLGENLTRMSKEHPCTNIVEYLDLLEGPSHFYVVMEELNGPELLQHMEELFPVTEVFLRSIMKQVLASLAHLHDVVHLFHRDIKLANYRFRGSPEDSALVLLDFGFATSTEQSWDGAVCGTTMFMAPELVAHKCAVPYLAATDVWSAGVILFVLITGDSPMEDVQVKLFAQPDKADEVDKIMEGVFNNPDLNLASSEPKDLLKQLLVLDPKDRITASEALKHEWFSIGEGMGQTLSVSKDKYRKVRSNSRISDIQGPIQRGKSGSGLGMSSTRSGGAKSPAGAEGAKKEIDLNADLGASAGLTRIVSVGDDYQD